MSHIDLPEPPDEYAPTGETIKAYGLACYEHGGASYKAGNTALLEALMDMVYQHCIIDEQNETLSHDYLSANENAFAILAEAGMMRQTDNGACFLDWAALEARKPKRQSWEEAVRECVSDPAEVERLLNLDKDIE